MDGRAVWSSSLLAQQLARADVFARTYARGWCEVCAQSLCLVYSIDEWARASRWCCWIKLDSPAADAQRSCSEGARVHLLASPRRVDSSTQDSVCLRSTASVRLRSAE